MRVGATMALGVVLVTAATVIAVSAGHFSWGDHPLVGRAEVTDGDTLRIHGVRIRLFGIDAPESLQICKDRKGLPYKCGHEATSYLQALVSGHTVDCTPSRGSRDFYKRTVASCALRRSTWTKTSNLDIADEMVRAGWAVEDRRYSKGRYTAAEAYARSKEIGIWEGKFDRPQDWRAQHGRAR